MFGNRGPVQHHGRWSLTSATAFASLGAMAFGYSVLETLASVFVVGRSLVFCRLVQAIHTVKVQQSSGFLLGLLKRQSG